MKLNEMTPALYNQINKAKVLVTNYLKIKKKEVISDKNKIMKVKTKNKKIIKGKSDITCILAMFKAASKTMARLNCQLK